MVGYIWAALILAASGYALLIGAFLGDGTALAGLATSIFDGAKLAVDVAIGLLGLLCFWLGLFEILHRSGGTDWVARLLTPLLSRLMPELPPQHPAMQSIGMNMGANLLGLDNAATPFGLQAMRDLQSLNPDKQTASAAQIMFMVINSSSVTLLPISIIMYRSQFGAADPAVVWLPILLATSCSTLTGIGLVAWKQNIPCDRILLAWLGGWCATLVLLALLIYLSPASLRSHYAGLFGQIALVAVVVGTLFAGMRAKRDLYDDFIRGAKTGIRLFIKIIPHLVAMITAISMLRASGLLEGLLRALEKLCVLLSIDPDFLPALPTALMKPLSGSGARATMIDTIQTHGVDSFPALVATVMQGSTETTFYVLTLYFGAVGIRRIRYALGVSLLADAAGMVAAVVVSYLFFA